MDYLERKNSFDFILYLDWLKNALSKKSFIDTDMINYPNGLDENDIKNISLLSELYFYISGYAKKNYIMPRKVEYGEYFIIEFNNNIYKLCFDIGQGASFYISEYKDKEISDLIDIKDVLNNKVSIKALKHDRALNDFKSNALKLYNDGIPFEYIENAIIELSDSIKERGNSRNRKK
jgi:hypothetical protein